MHFIGWQRPTQFWMITWFICLSSLGIFALLIKFTNDHPKNFIRVVLGSIVAKMLIYIVFVAIVIYIDQSNANSNVLLFLTLYLSTTITEIGILYKLLSARQ